MRQKLEEKERQIEELENKKIDLAKVNNDELQKKYDDLSIKYEQLLDKKMNEVEISDTEVKQTTAKKSRVTDDKTLDDVSDHLSDFTEIKDLREAGEKKDIEIEQLKADLQKANQQLATQDGAGSEDPHRNITLPVKDKEKEELLKKIKDLEQQVKQQQLDVVSSRLEGSDVMGDDGVTTQDLTSQQKSTLEPSKSQLAKIAALEKELNEKNQKIAKFESNLLHDVDMVERMEKEIQEKDKVIEQQE